MSVKTDGIISGIATSSLISELSAAMSRPKTLLENKVSNLEARQSAFAELNTKLTTLQESLEDIQAIKDFREFTASVNDTADDYFTVTTKGSATAGVYSIETTALAKSEMWILNGFSDNDTDAKINPGTITITWDDTSASGYSNITQSINSSSETHTLSTLASKLDKEAGITSYVMFDGTEYRLVVQGEDTGADYGFTISYTNSSTTSAGTNLTTSTGADATNVAAQDASLKLNGVDITSSSNVFSDAVVGMTITATDSMQSAGVSAQDVTVKLDTSAVSDKVDSFVENYNDIITYINARTKYDADKGIKGIFVGDSSVRAIVNTLRQVVTDQYTSLNTSNSKDVTLDSLSLLGVTFSTSNDGTMTFTSDTLVDALEDYQLDVEAMFSDDSTGFSETMVQTLENYVDPLTGILKKIDTNLDTQIDGLEDQIDRWESRIKSYEARLFKQFTAMEKIAGNAQTTSSFLTSFYSQDSD